jgi:kynurenine formamidase
MPLSWRIGAPDPKTKPSGALPGILQVEGRSTMRNWLLACAMMTVALFLSFATRPPAACTTRAAQPPPAANPLAVAGSPNQAPALSAASLADLVAGKLNVVDLTWPINDKNPYWPGENYEPFKLRTIATLEKDGVLSKAFCTPEHSGTHIDAPNHFERRQKSVDEIPLSQLFAPGVVIDVSVAVSMDPDYRVSVNDIRRFESTSGRIPDGAVVLAYTGWSRYWPNAARYANQDVRGTLHFPGFSLTAVEFLVRERKIRGVGIDTLSVDHGPSRDFGVHHALGKAGRYGLENLAKLKELPPARFYLIVAPMKIETGSGGPTRVLAILPVTGK